MVFGNASRVGETARSLLLDTRSFEPGGCTAFCSHSNSSTLIHPARALLGTRTAAHPPLARLTAIAELARAHAPNLAAAAAGRETVEPGGCTACRSHSDTQRADQPGSGAGRSRAERLTGRRLGRGVGGLWRRAWQAHAVRRRRTVRDGAFLAPGTLWLRAGTSLCTCLCPQNIHKRQVLVSRSTEQDLPFHNRLAYNCFHRRSVSPLAA